MCAVFTQHLVLDGTTSILVFIWTLVYVCVSVFVKVHLRVHPRVQTLSVPMYGMSLVLSMGKAYSNKLDCQSLP